MCSKLLFIALFVITVPHIFMGRGEKDLNAVQAAHEGIVSRLGGFAMFLTLILFLWALNLDTKWIILTNFDVSYLYFCCYLFTGFYRWVVRGSRVLDKSG